ncbi:MAG: D-tyrosyl-tRNA(Tyr) deacylase [Lentisphaerae bacterium]|nr:D-tyrosyl-tRNA(Tyr) deacylase [Lentisphaerota bacterium]
MKAVVQRVTAAAVEIDGVEVAAIGQGLLVLLGICHADSGVDVSWMVRKLVNLRIFSDDTGAMNLALSDIDGAVIVVSQFTLYGDARKGNRPGFSGAARPEHAEPLYEELLKELRSTLGEKRVGCGQFGAKMAVSLVNDGPVTILLESPEPKNIS